MKKLSDILLEAETLEHVKTIAEDATTDNSNTIIPPVTPVTADRVGAALQKLDQIGEMVDDLYNTFSHLEEIDAEADAALTGAYNSIDDLYAKIDDKYDIIPVDLDEYDIEEELELFTDVEIIVEKLSPDAPASEWIDDFIKSDAPQFKGKSKKERIKMALGAYYGAQQNEELELEEAKMSPQQRADAERVQYGAMKQDDYNKKWKLGKYRPAGNKLTGPGGLYKNLVKSVVHKEDVDLEESFRPGYDMVPAPIGKDTYQADGLRKLWGIKMRAGKWADTFVAMYADGKIGIVNDQGVNKYSTVDAFEKGFEKYRKSGDLDEAVNKEKVREKLASLKKAYQDIIDKKQDKNYTDKYDAQARIYHDRRLKEIPTELKKLRSKLLGEDLDLEESVNLPKIKELVSLALIDEKDVPATIAALKATQSDKALTPAQTKLLGNLAVMLTNVILGDTSALSSVKRAAKE